MKRTFSFLASLLTAIIIFAAEPVTTIFTVDPPMHCENCEKKIKSNIRFVKGIKEISTSVDNQQITVKYDPDKTSPETIADAFTKIGYKATQVNPDNATTPGCCHNGTKPKCCQNNGKSCCNGN